MRHFLILLKHELRMLFISPPTYIAAVLFLMIMGILYWAIIRGMVNTPEDTLPLVQFFRSFWIPVLFVVPLLTMRSVAEERANGTLDSLMTTPVSRGAIILSKFFGAYLFYMLLWATTLSFPLIAQNFFPAAADGGRFLEAAPMYGGFSFLAVSGVLFVSIGIFSSSITRSQLVAGMFTFTTLFVVIVGGMLLNYVIQDSVHLISWLGGVLSYLQIFQHLDDFSRGIIDTRPFIYYTSIGALLLGLSCLVIEAKA